MDEAVGMTAAQKGVLGALASYTGRWGDNAFPSNAALARRSGWSEATCWRVKAWAKANGLIRVTGYVASRRGSPLRVYQVLIEKIRQWRAPVAAAPGRGVASQTPESKRRAIARARAVLDVRRNLKQGAVTPEMRARIEKWLRDLHAQPDAIGPPFQLE